MMGFERSFSGAKIILHCEGALITYLRDDKPSIPFPALWDLPGGGREGAETPAECALREAEEEFGLRIATDRITWGRTYPSALHVGSLVWFFAAPVTLDEVQSITFGDEGQFWRMMTFQEFTAHPEAVPHLKAQVRDYLAKKI